MRAKQLPRTQLLGYGMKNQNCGSIPNRLHDFLFATVFIRILRPSETPVQRVLDAQFSKVKRSDFITYPNILIRPNIGKGR